MVVCGQAPSRQHDGAQFAVVREQPVRPDQAARGCCRPGQDEPQVVGKPAQDRQQARPQQEEPAGTMHGVGRGP